jgi:hypothetical protein
VCIIKSSKGKFIRNVDYIERAITFAIEQQIDLVNFSFEILEKKLIKKGSDFRYAILSYEQSISKIHISFLTLEKIANLIINIYQEVSSKLKENSRPKPMVICIFDKKRNSYYVLGSQGNYMSEHQSKLKKKSYNKLIREEVQTGCRKSKSEVLLRFLRIQYYRNPS